MNNTNNSTDLKAAFTLPHESGRGGRGGGGAEVGDDGSYFSQAELIQFVAVTGSPVLVAGIQAQARLLCFQEKTKCGRRKRRGWRFRGSTRATKHRRAGEKRECHDTKENQEALGGELGGEDMCA